VVKRTLLKMTGPEESDLQQASCI